MIAKPNEQIDGQIKPVGRKLEGAMNRSPSMKGLTRISPGMYRDSSGKIVGSRGQAIPQQPRPMQRPMANPSQPGDMQMGGVTSHIFDGPQNSFGSQIFDGPQNGFGGLANRIGSQPISYPMINMSEGQSPFQMGQGQGSQYTKPAITPSGGGQPMPTGPGGQGNPQANNQMYRYTPEDFQQMEQRYKDALNYQPSFKETQGRNDMGFAARKYYDDLAKQRQRVVANPNMISLPK